MSTVRSKKNSSSRSLVIFVIRWPNSVVRF